MTVTALIAVDLLLEHLKHVLNDALVGVSRRVSESLLLSLLVL